jgi:hypothetical protein
MVAIMMIKTGSDINIPRDIMNLKPFSITYLLKLCEDQNSLLAEVGEQIGRFIAQLSGYEQELYEKDVYIKKLEDELRHTLKATPNKRIVQ